MSDRTFGHKKAGTSTFSNPSLVSPTTPTLANPTRGFGLTTNNVIQTVTEESINLQEVQTADEQSLLSETIQQQSFGHDISRISLRRPQAKLTVGEPGDKYEQEADRTAAQVMSMPNAAVQPIQREAMLEEEDEVQTKPLAVSITPLVQREEISEEEEVQAKAIASIQREEMPDEEDVQTKPALQRSTDGGLQADSSIESRLNSSKGGGSPLADEVRSFMEPRFGADFSQVRVHTDSEAVQMNRDLNAQAFTHQQDVYFGAGKSPANDALTAHELTHVVQQDSAGHNRIQKTKLKNQFQEKSVPRNIPVVSTAPPLPPNVNRLTLQRESGQVSTAFSKLLVVQRDPKPKSVDNRLTDIEKQQKMLVAKQQATTLDLRWRGQFGELLSNYRQSIYRISGSFQKATTNFQATQTAQMQMDAVWSQVIALLATVLIAALFEPAMGGLGKALGKNEEQIKNWALKESLENPLNAAASGAANVATTIRGNDKANDRQTPAVQGGGVSAADPLSYLTQNLEEIEKHTQGIEGAFIARATKAETMTADEWEKWEPKAEEAKYKSLMDELKPIGPDIAKLKPAEEIAKIVERHLWAAWIRSHVPVVKSYGEHAQHKDAKTRTANDYDTVAISLGSEVEDKLNKIGISALAGVELTGHWYSGNSEQYRVKLFVWASNYSEKITNE